MALTGSRARLHAGGTSRRKPLRLSLPSGARVLLPALLLSLAACTPKAVRAPLPVLSPDDVAVAQSQLVAHEAAVAAAPGWSLQGRVGLSSGGKGGSGRIDWHQQGDAYEVALSAPVTRQSWRLSGDAGSAQLEGLDDGARTDSDPQRLLREATGWEIPVAALSSWVRGARADESRFGPATVAFGADRRLARIEQAGWVVDYTAWQPVAGVGLLPLRLNAERGAARVRLVVDRWGGAAAP